MFPCPRLRLRIWSRETGSAVPSRVSLLILHTQAESSAYSRGSSRLTRRRPFIYVNRHTSSGQSRDSLSGHEYAYRWRSLPRVRRHSASSPQGRFSNGCCLCRSPWTRECAPLFSHTHYCLCINSGHTESIGGGYMMYYMMYLSVIIVLIVECTYCSSDGSY